jgi:hypothetical protein
MERYVLMPHTPHNYLVDVERQLVERDSMLNLLPPVPSCGVQMLSSWRYIQIHQRLCLIRNVRFL